MIQLTLFNNAKAYFIKSTITMICENKHSDKVRGAEVWTNGASDCFVVQESIDVVFKKMMD